MSALFNAEAATPVTTNIGGHGTPLSRDDELKEFVGSHLQLTGNCESLRKL